MKASQISYQDRFALLGSSRGLGWSTYQALEKSYPQSQFLLSSRKIAGRKNEISLATTLVPQDFSKSPVNESFLNVLKTFHPTTLVYFAGGGPYGLFGEKKWSDHQWALHTTFLYPAELVHSIFSDLSSWPDLRQIVLIGSAIAEAQPDPLAASYAAAKHALKGLVTSMQKESISLPRLRLFSPGYMQTDLLPANSKPRQLGLSENPFDVAKKLIAFIEKSD